MELDTTRIDEAVLALPRVHPGPYFAIAETAFERAQAHTATAATTEGGGVATAAWSATQPMLDVEAQWPDQYEYYVLLFDKGMAFGESNLPTAFARNERGDLHHRVQGHRVQKFVAKR
jgi:hypothetical protein